MEEERLSGEECPQGRQALDREEFERVWRRVMPQDRPDCPFTLAPQAQAPCAPTGEVPLSPCPTAPSATLPLQRQFFFERREAAYCRRLARTLWGSHAQVLSRLAAEHTAAAKRLGGTYFLLTGVRLSPPRICHRSPQSPLPALRERYAAAQEAQAAYRSCAAAAEEDSALSALYLELSRQAQLQAGLLRGVLEKL